MSAPKIVQSDRAPEPNLAWFDLPVVGPSPRPFSWLRFGRDVLAVVGAIAIILLIRSLWVPAFAGMTG